MQKLRDFSVLEKPDPKENEESKMKFLSKFKMTDSLITGEDRENLYSTIVEFNDIFARHKVDIGINSKSEFSLTPQDDKPVFTQSLPVPIKLKENLTLQLALMHRYGINHHDTIFLQICKSHLGTTESQQLATTSGGFTQDQRPHR